MNFSRHISVTHSVKFFCWSGPETFAVQKSDVAADGLTAAAVGGVAMGSQTVIFCVNKKEHPAKSDAYPSTIFVLAFFRLHIHETIPRLRKAIGS